MNRQGREARQGRQGSTRAFKSSLLGAGPLEILTNNRKAIVSRSSLFSFCLPWRSSRPWRLLPFLLLASCGYTTADLYPDDYRTVALPILDNRTAYRGVEYDLTEALAKQLEQRTPYKVTAAARADTIIEGTVVGVEQRQLSRTQRGGLPQEIEVALVANLTWKDLRSGDIIRDRKGFTTVGRHVPTQPVGEPFETAQHSAVERMAEQFVSEMRADWR